MTIKLSGPMENVLKRMGNGDDYDDFGIHGPLSLAARVRTCDALVKRGLMVQTLFGHYLLTEPGEALAMTLNDRADPSSSPKGTQFMQTEQSPSPRQPIVRRYFFGMTSHIELACGHSRDERVMWSGSEVVPGEATTCFDCGLVAAGLMPTEEQLQVFRREHGTE